MDTPEETLTDVGAVVIESGVEQPDIVSGTEVVPPETVLINFLNEYEKVVVEQSCAFVVALASYLFAFYAIPDNHEINKYTIAFWMFGNVALVTGMILNVRRHDLRGSGRIHEVIAAIKSRPDER